MSGFGTLVGNAADSGEVASGLLACNVYLAGGADTVDSRMALERRSDWSGVGGRRWSPWGMAFGEGVEEDAVEGGAELGPITLSEYGADRRWKLRDKCLRVATYYRVMHMRERSRRTACMHRLRKLFAGWAASFLVHTRHAAARVVHEERTAVARAGRRGLVSAVTRMRMTAPDLYRTERRNAPRRRAPVGARRRVRLPTVVDTEIGARLYGDMCTIGSWVHVARGDG